MDREAGVYGACSGAEQLKKKNIVDDEVGVKGACPFLD